MEPRLKPEKRFGFAATIDRFVTLARHCELRVSHYRQTLNRGKFRKLHFEAQGNKAEIP
jgi:hypothetical protein